MELDRLLDMLAARHSPQARLVSDEPVQVWSDSGWISANTPLVGGQLNRMLGLVAPPEVRAFVHDLNTQYEFDHLHPSGLYLLHVKAVNGRRTVIVTRLDENGQLLRPVEEAFHPFPVPHETDTPPLPVPSDASITIQSPTSPTQTVPVSTGGWKLEDEPEPTPLVPPPPKQVAPRAVVSEGTSLPHAPATILSPTTVPSPIPTAPSNHHMPQGTPEAHWFYGHANQSMGPHTKEEMAALIASGALLKETMVFDSRVGDWQQAKLSALSGFFPLKSEGEWVNPSVRDWKPQTEGEVRAEKAFVRLIGGSVIGAVVLLIGWIALAQMRGANRAYDYSKEFAQKVEKDTSSSPNQALHNVRLTRDENEHSHYLGTGQYANGYLADVQLDVTGRDFWSQPEKTDVSATAHEFAPELASLIKGKINSELAKAELKARVDRITLDHGKDNDYSGVVYFERRVATPISARILQFDDNGSILRWEYQALSN